MHSSMARLRFLTVCLLGITKRSSSSHAAEAWKIKGGFGRTRLDLDNDGWASQDTKLDSDSWESHDTELHKFLGETIPEALAHTGSITFDEHLKGVQSVLRCWGSDLALCDAGLFHSIYGTEGFQGYKLPFSRRQDIRNLIGTRAERLAWIFCVVDRASVDRTLYNTHKNIEGSITGFQDTVSGSESSTDKQDSDKHAVAEKKRVFEFTSREELGRFPILLKDEEEWLDFLELTLADWLEQVEGAAEKENPLFEWSVGESWSYRRLAYHRMADILSFKRAPRLLDAKRMCEDVYAMEPEGTRGLHQERTPPMCQAAKDAREAMLSIHA